MDALTPGVTKASQFKETMKTPVYLSVAEALEKARGPLTTTPRVSAHHAWAWMFGGERVSRILVPAVSGQTMGCWPEPWLCGVAAAWLRSSPQGLKGRVGSVYVALYPWLLQTDVHVQHVCAGSTHLCGPSLCLLTAQGNKQLWQERGCRSEEPQGLEGWDGLWSLFPWEDCYCVGTIGRATQETLMPPSVLQTFRRGQGL